MKKVLICTIIAIILDLISIGILVWLAMQAINVILWLILALVSLSFIFDIRQAVRFFNDFKRIHNIK